jgi:uncharacterized membrane protein
MTVMGRQRNRERSRDRLVTGDDGSLDYPLTRARVTPIIYFGVTTCHQAREGLHLAVEKTHQEAEMSFRTTFALAAVIILSTEKGA